MYFSGAIIKLASRCNLNCSYCYMYNLGDSTWLDQPNLMSVETIDKLIDRVAEHCITHQQPVFTFGFHGGEPLLIPSERMSYFVQKARTALGQTEARFQIQTNGVLLTPRWCDTLLDLGVQLGVSIDGTHEVNDRYRVDHQGRGSYDRVLLGLENARRAGLSYGILTVVDPSSNPRETFDHLVHLGPRSVDLLLPEATHDSPPEAGKLGYGEWMLEFFECWSVLEQPPFRVRRFDQVISTVLGLQPPRTQSDQHPNRVVVIETDGSIEPVDVLRVCQPGMTRTEMNVRTHALDKAFDNELVRHYYASYERLNEVCRRCSIRSICGGGYLPHRYRDSNGFDNPSVYCDDLAMVIRGIQRWTVKQLPPWLARDAGVEMLD